MNSYTDEFSFLTYTIKTLFKKIKIVFHLSIPQDICYTELQCCKLLAQLCKKRNNIIAIVFVSKHNMAWMYLPF